MKQTKQNLNDLARDQIRAILEGWGEPAYRATQICKWLYGRRAMSFDDMSNLPLRLRDRLAKHFTIARLSSTEEATSSRDRTVKYLLSLPDGNSIESVYLPHPRGATLCISSQVGCAYRCGFCATATLGLKRNLSPGEIVDQVSFLAEHITEQGVEPQREISPATRSFSNIVFMGMGEPFANYDNVSKALSLLMEELGIGARRITISTCGIPDGIMRFAEEPNEVGLAISLHSPFDEVRQELMPVAGRTPLVKLLNAARYCYEKKRRFLTFEYVLIDGINDRVRDAHALASLVREVPAKINLIALNPFPGCPYQPPKPAVIRRFQAVLESRGRKVTLRKSLGYDILAGCGQLGARRQERGDQR